MTPELAEYLGYAALVVSVALWVAFLVLRADPFPDEGSDEYELF